MSALALKVHQVQLRSRIGQCILSVARSAEVMHHCTLKHFVWDANERCFDIRQHSLATRLNNLRQMIRDHLTTVDDVVRETVV